MKQIATTLSQIAYQGIETNAQYGALVSLQHSCFSVWQVLARLEAGRERGGPIGHPSASNCLMRTHVIILRISLMRKQ